MSWFDWARIAHVEISLGEQDVSYSKVVTLEIVFMDDSGCDDTRVTCSGQKFLIKTIF